MLCLMMVEQLAAGWALSLSFINHGQRGGNCIRVRRNFIDVKYVDTLIYQSGINRISPIIDSKRPIPILLTRSL